MAVALLAMSGTATAATLVVRSSGPAAKSYPAGRALAAGRKIVLGAIDMVTILDAKGTRTFRGPGSFDPTGTATSASAGTTLAALVSQPTQRRARIGAVRSVGGAAPRSPNLWYVDAAHPGTQCVADPASVTLWRPDMTTDQSVTISGGGRTETVAWRKGQSAQGWPASLPVTSGAEYRLSAGGQAMPGAVRFVVLDRADTALDALAGRLIGAGCKVQLDLLVDAAAAPDAGVPQG